MTEPSKSDQTRARILATGRALVLARGFGGVGLKDILAAAGVPKGSFYYYFPSKEAFGCALLDGYVQEYLAALDGLIALPEPAAARMARYFNAALGTEAATMADRCLVVKLAAEIADLSEDMRQILDAGVAQVCARLALLLREGATDGSLASHPDPERSGAMLYAQWLGAAIHAKLSRSRTPLEQAMEDTRARFFT
ncbi:TetR/AcrR family transcriptional regulator [Oceanicola sp. 502str15]|uniref:TetR/AcrR family transcriptional regulator n=1 Tax=Oceanicola sp. 502str15 TaxID=2696061 RepID=UPI0020956B53|nr:TetR/AcrR family transcriptional regulator [Oceanicola sp. 502str15]MCO6381381.1 TetR family transcriptional regulator [Oceanicola sp. 502str15]